MALESAVPASKRRGLSQPLMDELLDPDSGISRVLAHVKRDSTLAFEIRCNYFNIYYRGGSIAKVSRKGPNLYAVEFNMNYFGGSPVPVPLVPEIGTRESAESWIATVPHLKNAMDLFFGTSHKNEREYQQLVVRDNNDHKSGNATDYFICDLEYASPSMRFDLVAAHWPSTSASHKNPHGKGLAVIEVKVLDAALGGSASLAKHLSDYHDFVGSKNLDLFREEMRDVFAQKVELGLINCKYPIESFMDSVPAFVLLLINHDPASKKLFNFLKDLPAYPEFDLKIATACFTGYSLYDQGMYEVDEFRSRFKDQIYCGK